MEELSLPQKLLLLFKQNLLISGLFAIGVVCLLVGLIQYFSPKSETITFESAQEVKSASTELEQNKHIFVDVSGEVNNPGLYEFEPQKRVKDALDKAGGLSSEADSTYISKNLNLAAPLADGMKIYIPRAGEQSAAQLVTSGSGTDTGGSNIISINNSSQSELEELSGVGPVTAQKIISNRPYGSLEELVSKKSIGQSLFSRIKDQISL